MSVVTDRCKDCVYYRSNSTGHSVLPTCDYILVEYHSRGCPAGDECTHFVMATKRGAPGRLRLSVDESLVFDLYWQGKTDAEIGKALDVPPATITHWRCRRDLPSQKSIRRSVMDED